MILDVVPATCMLRPSARTEGIADVEFEETDEIHSNKMRPTASDQLTQTTTYIVIFGPLLNSSEL